MTEKTFKKGEVIFRQGEQGDVFYQVQDGCVGIYAQYGEAEEVKLTELAKDQYFGEMAVIESYPRSASAVSLSDDTKVLEVAGDDINAYLSEDPDRILALMRHLGDRLKALTDDYNDVSAVITEMKESGKDGRSESLKSRILKHIASFKARKRMPVEVSAEHFNDMMDEDHTPTWEDKLVTYPAGTVICREDETVHCMYEIHQGKVGIYTGYNTDKEKKLTELYPNTFFGEAGMLRDEPRSATVVALDETTVEIFYREDLKELFEKNPPKVGMILKNLSYRLRYLTDRYTEACAMVADAVEDEEKNGEMSPELAEKLQNFKSRLYG